MSVVWTVVGTCTYYTWFLFNPFFSFVHCRIPWFHYPIVYDIRSRPRKIFSPTGSKGTYNNHGTMQSWHACLCSVLILNTTHNLHVQVYVARWLPGNSENDRNAILVSLWCLIPLNGGTLLTVMSLIILSGLNKSLVSDFLL